MHIPRQNRRDGAHPLPVPKEVDEDTHTSRHPHPRYAEPRFIEIPQALKADRTSSGSHIPLRIYVVLDTQPTVMFRTRRQDNRQQEPFFSAKPLLMKDSHSYTGAIAEKSPPPILLLRGPCEEIFASVLYSDVSEQADLLR